MNAKDPMLRFFIAVTGLATACNGPAPTQNYGAAVPVNVYQVQREGAAYVNTYPATIVALSQVEVRSEVNGFITAVHFEDGTRVRKGQQLYEIDRSKFLAAYNQAKANLRMAEINQDKAGKDAGRYSRLNQANAVPKQRYEYALTDFENAKQQVALAQAQLSNAGTDLGHSVIRAPFDGTIGVSLVKPGTFIAAGQTPLNTISSAGPVAVDFQVSEKHLDPFSELNRQPPAPADSVFTIVLPDGAVYPYPGKIALLDRAVDPQTGTLRVRLTFPNPYNQLKPGMSCNLRVRSNAGKQELLAPFKAVTEQMGEYFVYTVQGDTARQRRVDLGERLGEKVIVLRGLQPGEQIVVEGIGKLREGTAVQVNNDQRAAAAPTKRTVSR